MGLVSLDDLLIHLADELSGLAQALFNGIDLETSRTAPIFNPDELSGTMYLARHEPSWVWLAQVGTGRFTDKGQGTSIPNASIRTAGSSDSANTR